AGLRRGAGKARARGHRLQPLLPLPVPAPRLFRRRALPADRPRGRQREHDSARQRQGPWIAADDSGGGAAAGPGAVPPRGRRRRGLGAARPCRAPARGRGCPGGAAEDADGDPGAAALGAPRPGDPAVPLAAGLLLGGVCPENAAFMHTGMDACGAFRNGSVVCFHVLPGSVLAHCRVMPSRAVCSVAWRSAGSAVSWYLARTSA
ncbi:unnamed protein product, partial [Prorocentrum cordatum]